MAAAAAHGLSLEQAVSQLLMVSVPGTQVDADIQRLFQAVNPGSVIFYTPNIENAAQLRQFTAQLSTLSPHIPPLFAIDQEGGRVQRLHTPEFTQFPSARSLAETNNLQLITQTAEALAQELLATGCHMTLAPVVDVDTNPINPVIGMRSFGTTTERVIRCANAYLEGLRKRKVLTCLKHWPGHGDTSTDSHFDLPTVNKSQDEIERVEMAPFLALAEQSDAVMSAHILMPQLDLQRCATFSPEILGRLRQNYNGVLISDSLTMQGALAQAGKDLVEASILALNAGCDMLCIGGLSPSIDKITAIQQGILAAVQEGRLSAERIQTSAQRILRMKYRLPGPVDPACIGSDAHRQLVRQVAECSVHTVKNQPRDRFQNAPIFYSTKAKRALSLLQLTDNAQELDSEEELPTSLPERQIWVLCDAFTNAGAQAKMQTLQAKATQITLITAGSPHDTTLQAEHPNVKFVANTYSPTPDAIAIALAKLYTSPSGDNS